MNCQFLFSRENKNNIMNVSSADLSQKEVNVKDGSVTLKCDVFSIVTRTT